MCIIKVYLFYVHSYYKSKIYSPEYIWHTLRKEYGCEHYIRVIRAILYCSETDTSSIAIRAISFGHDSYSSMGGVRWL